MSAYKTLDDLSVNGKVVLVRADLNVPMKDGKVSDDSRLRAFLPTLIELSKKGAKVAILSHLGRPKGIDPSLSLAPIAEALAALFGHPIAFAPACTGSVAKEAIAKLQDGQAIVLENTRFHPEEEKNDPAFTAQIAELGDFYVNDAFSAAHRAHATTAGLAALLPSAAGRLMQGELDALSRVLDKPERPVAALVGGSKISTKLDLLKNLITKVDVLVIGGAMANTFLGAQGYALGKSLTETDMYDTARFVMDEAKKHNCEIVLPRDVVVAKALKENEPCSIVSAKEIPSNESALDVGPQTLQDIKDHLVKCKSVLWNGPLGAFEFVPFDRATTATARVIANLTAAHEIVSVAGGGDTVAAIAHAGVEGRLTYVSMAGGAFLEWLEGKTLPGVAALLKA